MSEKLDKVVNEYINQRLVEGLAEETNTNMNNQPKDKEWRKGLMPAGEVRPDELVMPERIVAITLNSLAQPKDKEWGD
jgi:hypothetical protein